MQNNIVINANIEQNKNISASIENNQNLTASGTQRGPQGIPGEAATIELGTVNTGEAGTDVIITNSGTENAAVFNFTIPRGDKGEQGIQGEQGETGNGIINTEYVSSSGLVDTYHVNYTNGNYDTFTVTNGRDGAGAVTDVRVNNQSVLVGNVANLTVDNALNKNSSNPVENSVVAQAIEEITLAKNPNLNIIGSNLIIDSGNVSGFSSSDYMQFPFIFNFNNYHWTLEMGFTTGADITTQQNILDSKFGIALAIIGGQFVLAISSNGTSWDIGNVTGTYSVQPNTSYSVKLSWDGASYTLGYSLDETNYITDITIASTLVHNATQEYVGGEADIWNGSYFPFGGTINLNNWKLTVNGLDVWLGMDDVGLGSRANIDLSNLTQAGIDVIKSSIPIATTLQAGIVKPDGNTITVEDDGTINANILGYEVGDIIIRNTPTSDAGKHLLDGALIQYGSYQAFVDYIAGLVTDYPDLFVTENDWQQAVTTYGYCGKYVYDSVNSTVRLPKYGNQLNTKLDSTAQTTYNGSPFTMQIGINNNNKACFYLTCGTYGYGMDGANRGSGSVWTQASGDFEDVGHQPILADLASASAPVDVYYYIVIANSTKTDIQVDIDEIATDLNGKADVDGTNIVSNFSTSLVNNMSDTANIYMSGMSMPSDTYIDLTLGASGTQYTAPANGWVWNNFSSNQNMGMVNIENATKGNYSVGYRTSAGYALGKLLPVSKGDIFRVSYDGTATNYGFRFYYAQGSESEAQ